MTESINSNTDVRSFSAATGSAKPLILIVDDSPTIRLSLSRALKDEFLPIEAEDGEQAGN